MKRILLVFGCAILLPAPARAADYAVPVIVPKAPYVEPVVYSWTGGYIGGEIGYSFGDNAATFTFFPDFFGTVGLPATTGMRSSGITGGAEWGYNYQIGKVVFGVESDISWIDRRASVSANGVAIFGIPFTTVTIEKLDWLGTSRVRLGVTPFDRLMIYATGGVAYGHVTAGTTVSFPLITYANEQSRRRPAGPPVPGPNTHSPTRSPPRPSTSTTTSAAPRWSACPIPSTRRSRRTPIST
jgi:outer membrane immunogenic protein